MKHDNRVKPVTILSLDDLHNFYWTKSELIEICNKYELSTQGIKSDLIKRIDTFLSTGYNHHVLQ